MDERVAVRTAAMGLQDKEQGFGGKLISAIPQVPAVLFSGADTGTSLIQNGERLSTAITGTLVDTAGNAVSLVIPGSKGSGFLVKAGTGAAISAGQDLAVRTTLSGISDTQASKDQFGPTLETTALAAVPGAAYGVASKAKAYISSAKLELATVEQSAHTATSESTSTAFDGKLYPPEKLQQLVPYLEKRGVSVYGTEGNPRFSARRDGTGMMELPANPTELQVKHELSHYLDFKNLGFEPYKDMGRTGREAAVLGRLQSNRIWSTLNPAEQKFSIDYVERLKNTENVKNEK
jgi:hypothetical protein